MYKTLAGAAVAACLLAFSPSHAQEAAPLKVGFVYVAPVTDAGWVRQHELGRQAVQAAFGDRVQTSFVENVAEGPDAERVIRDLAASGHKLIFTPSFGYMEPTLKVARDFPQVKFESITGYKTAANVATANARYYEGRYLAGIAAGRMTKTHLAGYVAGFPIPEVLQGINAFTLGMRSVDPQAQVKVLWLDKWFDPAREREAAMALGATRWETIRSVVLPFGRSGVISATVGRLLGLGSSTTATLCLEVACLPSGCLERNVRS